MTRDDPVTLFAATEGLSTCPLFCGPKLELLQWAQDLEAAHILYAGAEWVPCCRDTFANVGCILDHFRDDEDDHARAMILQAAAGRTLPPPTGIIPSPEELHP